MAKTKTNKFLVGGITAAVVASALVPVVASANEGEDLTKSKTTSEGPTVDFDLSNVANPFVDVSENSSHYEGILFGYKNGILFGYGDKFSPADNIKRVHTALMVARALGATPNGNYADSGFTDVPENYKWAVNFLVQEGIVHGTSPTTFGSNNFTTRGQMAKILVNAFDLSSEDSLAYLDNIEADPVQFGDTSKNQFKKDIALLSRTGVTVGTGDGNYAPNTNVTRAQFATFIHRSFEYNESVKEFIQSQEGEVIELAVEDIAILNSKEIQVKFNEAVKVNTLKDNFTIKIGNEFINPDSYTITLSENEKTVTITLRDRVQLTQGAGLEITVSDKILSKEFEKGLEKDFTKTIVFSDKIAPKLVSVTTQGEDVILTFDEYIDTAEVIKINGVTVAIPTPPIESLKTIKLVDALSDLPAGTHDVVVSGVTDLLGNKSGVLIANFKLSAQEFAPKISSVEQYDNTTVKVKFDRNVNFVSSGEIKLQRNGFDLSTTMTKVNDREYLVSATDLGSLTVYDDKAKTTTLKVIAEGFKSIKTGELGAKYEQAITLTKDEVGPVVKTSLNKVVDKGVGSTYDEVIAIEFDEDITIAGADSDIVITDKDGIRYNVTGTSVYTDNDGNKKVLEVSVASLQDGNGKLKVGTYNVHIAEKYVKDKYGNESARTNFKFTVKGTSDEDNTGVTVSGEAISSNTISLTFNEQMGSEVTNLSNYTIDGKRIPENSVVYLSSDKKTLTIELPAESIKVTGSPLISISEKVKTTTGKAVDKTSRTLTLVGNLVDNTSPILVSATKKSVNTIELVFSENLDDASFDANVGENDFKVLVNGVEYGYTVATGETADDNKLLLTTSDEFVLGNYVTIQVTDVDDDISITDAEGNKLKSVDVIVAR